METNIVRSIRVFIASSEELLEERDQLSVLLQGLNRTLNRFGINFIVDRWEYMSSKWEVPSKQRACYNEAVRASDICIVLFWTRRGKYTLEELDVAFKSLCPEIGSKTFYIYFKSIEPSDIKEKDLPDDIVEIMERFKTHLSNTYGNWTTPFRHIDTLKAEVYRNLILYLFDDLTNPPLPPIVNGEISIGGKTTITLSNIPFVKNNETYNSLCGSIEATKEFLINHGSDSPFSLANEQRLIALKKKRDDLEKALWETALFVSRMKMTVCSARMKQAIELFERGDSRQITALLDTRDLISDLKFNLNLVQVGDEARRNLQMILDELMLKIKVLTDEKNEGWIDEVKFLYDRCFEIGENNLSKEKYLDLLSGCAFFYDSIADNEKALGYFLDAVDRGKSLLGKHHPLVATFYERAGICYASVDKEDEAFTFLKTALYIRLAAFRFFHPAVGRTYNCIGITYGRMKLYNSAMENLLNAKIIIETLQTDEYSILPGIYSNIGMCYFYKKEYDNALSFLKTAVELMDSNSSDTNLDNHKIYANIGLTYQKLKQYGKAIENLERSLNMRLRLFGAKHEYVISLYETLAETYRLKGDDEKARQYEQKAKEARKKPNNSRVS